MEGLEFLVPLLNLPGNVYVSLVYAWYQLPGCRHLRFFDYIRRIAPENHVNTIPFYEQELWRRLNDSRRKDDQAIPFTVWLSWSTKVYIFEAILRSETDVFYTLDLFCHGLTEPRCSYKFHMLWVCKQWAVFEGKNKFFLANKKTYDLSRQNKFRISRQEFFDKFHELNNNAC